MAHHMLDFFWYVPRDSRRSNINWTILDCNLTKSGFLDRVAEILAPARVE
jgi:hypothetical protein